MCFAWLIDQNFNSVAPEIHLAQPLTKCFRYLGMCGTEFSTGFTATVDIEQQAVITSLKNFLVKKAGKVSLYPKH